MTRPVSRNDRIGIIAARKEFRGFHQFITPNFPGALGLLVKLTKLSTMAHRAKTWSADDMTNGLNRIIELVNQGHRLHHAVWSDAEIAQDPRKKDTALFHFPANSDRPFVLVCAGGAYLGVASIVEGFPVAAELNRMGFNAFVLHYRTGTNNPWHTPMEDLQHALRVILLRADAFGVHPEHYAVAGFSAGGHLAASFGTDNYGYRKWSLPKPAALLLGYPVTMFERMTPIHKRCRDTMIGANPTQEQIDSINIVKHADRAYPPTYLMHCRDDDAVYFENSEMLAQKLIALGVPCQLKAAPSGGHGIALGNGTSAQGWLAEAVRFWQSH